MKYIKTFKEHTEFVDSGCAYYINVAYCRKEDEVHYCMDRPEPEPEEYLTFTMLTDGDIYWQIKQGNVPVTIEYSLNGGEWTEITSDASNPPTIQVSAGDIIQFKGNNASYTYTGKNFSSTGFYVDGEFDVSGNIMSMLGDPEYINSEGWFYRFFEGCTGLTSAENLLLPATTLTYGCYMAMFQGCTSLTTAPELPATTLATICYNSMFSNCTSLTEAPELPATTLAESCYESMFAWCTITAAPELPATTLANHCYYGMFRNCPNLNYIKCLATDISATDCTSYWVQTNSGTFIAYGCGIGWSRGSDGIPNGWTVYDKDGNDINDCYPERH